MTNLIEALTVLICLLIAVIFYALLSLVTVGAWALEIAQLVGMVVGS